MNCKTHWLAGLLEGEGCFMKGTPCQPKMLCISVQMTDEDVVRKIAKIFGVKCQLLGPREEHHKPVFLAKIRGSKAAEIMEYIRPLMGQRRQQQIDRALSCYSVRDGQLTREQVQEIKGLLDSGMTQTDVSKMFDVSRVAIHNIHRNKTHKSSIPVS